MTSPLSVGFLKSTDTLVDGTDSLLSTITIDNAADLAVGSHTLNFTIGNSVGSQVQLPGVGTTTEVATDYFILAVADPTNTITETDSDPLNEDNTVPFIGVYATSTTIHLHGGAAADTVTLTYPSSTSGNVTLGLSGSLSATYTRAYNSTAQFRVRTHGGNDKVNIVNSSNLTARPMFERGGTGIDMLNGTPSADTLHGGTGHDSLQGGNGNDSLNGDSGNDTLIGGPNADSLDGGDGNDSITGGGGNDKLSGGNGNDRLYGLAGNDTMFGGLGNDTLDGGTENDVLLGEDGIDSLLGGLGNDVLSGGFGNNTLNGNDGNDTILGGTGADNILGGNGIDLLIGDEDNDTLSGQAGIDSLSGGAGSNTLIDVANGTLSTSDDDIVGVFTFDISLVLGVLP